MRAITIIFVAMLLMLISACASTAQSQLEIGSLTLLTDTISISRYEPLSGGYNYWIEGIVLKPDGGRVLIRTHATDCQARHGGISGWDKLGQIYDFRSNEVKSDNLIIGGSTPADSIFTLLCSVGLPKAEKDFSSIPTRSGQ